MQRTLIILKPDCVKSGNCLNVIGMMKAGGFEIVAAKAVQLDDKILREHYAHHAERPFFPALCEFMKSCKVLVMVAQQEDAVNAFRELCGPTDSNLARKESPNSIRAKYGKDKSENCVHASDSDATARLEVGRFFTKDEIAKMGKPMAQSEIENEIAKLYR
ncbi:MAG: nucleoside-diphosphate kinase [Candidatus Micrarchaeota archaeon]|nr:nucleoside-diphosphate kinase [Candidatus Micrarchaeota archaeon]